MKHDYGEFAMSSTVVGLPEFCDEALALEFSERYADTLRYCDLFGRWFEWDGARWQPDERRRVFTLSRTICREAAARARTANKDGAKLAAAVGSARSTAAVVSLARADERHATLASDWDADPWSLNTPAGIVDLRSGELGGHDRDALCSKVTAVAPNDEGCELWRDFLEDITAGDKDLQAFLQRVVGYMLTGVTREHALFFGYGTGTNGKGVFVNTITAILNDYARVAPMEVFTESHNDRHPTELAMMRGARLVSAQETEDGRRWAESKIKALTGGDPITARYMRADFFTFDPQFKLFIVGNHKPGLRNVDEAIRRRFRLIPFTVTIPKDRIDKDLTERLKAEHPGILAWAIQGCLDWQRHGLNPPSAVTAATEEYFAEQDQFAAWLDECTERDGYSHEATRDLFTAWKRWAEAAGISPLSEPKFRERLKHRGFEPKRLPGDGRSGFVGLRLLRHDYTDDARYGG